ncbi:GNAT family N-acetyltransferase [Kitasatospora sp. NBC_01250]|uniref:GNAT family N-acetyltransferase n=1 Tax=Kitasatospora sp. NBC_01250 TaxID=2903571 RepID=UPI002E300302|nr:GNAT family N-acetyltransferase [Kitasatospora sp. NBC_01250]
MSYTIRAYTPADETTWLRCRVLSFLDTPYFDDVLRTKPVSATPGPDLVAVDASGAVVAIMDVGIEGELATVDTVAVHPDHQRRGLGRRLLREACSRARQLGATTLDAWTRDHPGTLAWYRDMGFTESSHYLHVYANHYTAPEEPVRAVEQAGDGLRPIAAFLHARLADEERLRGEYTRVHVCRRFALPLSGPGSGLAARPCPAAPATRCGPAPTGVAAGGPAGRGWSSTCPDPHNPE